MEEKPGSKTNSNYNIIRTRQGTSRSYALSRLDRENKKLFEAVKAGRLSAIGQP